jgi:hypothetical protein
MSDPNEYFTFTDPSMTEEQWMIYCDDQERNRAEKEQDDERD